MPDLDSRSRIHDMLVAFYSKVMKDEQIGYLFTDVAHLDLEHHIPNIENFWCSLLLGDNSYDGYPMRAHFKLNDMEPLTEAHFKRWLEVFCQTIDESYTGEKATEAKTRATNIAVMMNYRLSGKQHVGR